MKKLTFIVMTLALVLGFTQCKKEQVDSQNEGNTVRITLDVNEGNKDSRAGVDPPHVNFIEHDTILVASDGKYVGYLVHNGTTFSGDITNPTEGKPLYFYFLGNKMDVTTLTAGSEGSTSCTVNISDQTDYPHLPVISMGVSIDRSNHNAIVNYSSEVTDYEAQLHNKASLMKFNVTTPSDSPICITGMNNQVTVNFADRSENDGFSYGKVNNDGIIKLKGGSGTAVEKWAIVLQQDAYTTPGAEGTAYTLDGNYMGARPVIPAITMNQYIDENRVMEVRTLNPEGSLSTPLTFEAITAGATVTFTKATNVSGTVQYSTNGSTWKNYTTAITLTNEGDKVMFRGDNSAYYYSSGDTKASQFSCSADCYIYGNIMSLVSSTDYATTTSVGNYAFREMFKNNKNIKSHVTKDLILPATSIGDNCYAYMFQYCEGLTTSPVILAATLNGSNCCAGMLEGTSLTSVPELHVTNLVRTCFKNMFKGCSNLTSVPSDYLPYNTLNEYCYEGMFHNCSKLTSVPNLPATSLAKGSYKNMFNGCTKLSSVTCYATDISAEECIINWLYEAGTNADSPTLYVKSSMANATWNNEAFTVSHTLE